jgi:hypothetical protein
MPLRPAARRMTQTKVTSGPSRPTKLPPKVRQGLRVKREAAEPSRQAARRIRVIVALSPPSTRTK